MYRRSAHATAGIDAAIHRPVAGVSMISIGARDPAGAARMPRHTPAARPNFILDIASERK